MPSFNFTSPDGKTYTVQGPDGATPEQAFQILQGQLGGGGSAAGADAAPDIGRGRASTAAALRAIPFGGAYTDKAIAALNAAAQPFTETGLSHADTFGQRMAENEDLVKRGTDKFEEDNPIGTTVGKMAIGSVPYAVAGEFAGPAKLLGMTGDTLGGMAVRGAASGGIIGAGDAALRGDDPVTGAIAGAIPGAIGPALGRGIGAGVRKVKSLVSPPPRIPNTVDLNGNTVRVPQSGVTGSGEDQFWEERARKGVLGDEARMEAEAGDARTQADTQKAVDQFGSQINGGQGPTPTPTEAAGQTITELAQQHNDQITAQARHEAQLAAEGASIRHDVSAPAGAPEHPELPSIAYAQGVQQELQAAEQRAAANRTRLYQQEATSDGSYHPQAWAPVGEQVRAHVAAPGGRARPVTIVPGSQLTSNAEAMLGVLDRLGRGEAPRPPPPAPAGPPNPAAAQLARDVADIRARYGDAAAEAYARQQAGQPANRAQSLNEFLATKGGLGPDPELEAIGAHTHTVNVEGTGRRKLVRQGGMPLDYAREAAEEAGYLPQGSSPRDLLDAIDGEMRGQRLYPQGQEGYQGSRAGAARSEREQHEFDQHTRGLEDELANAGHSDLGPEVRARAVRLMQQGMDADTAVEHAFAQLEQEDAARGSSGFPGDRPAPARGLTPADIEAARQEMLGYLQDARTAQARGGSGTDAYAAQRVMDAFDRFHQAVTRAPGAFQGDAEGYLNSILSARRAHASYRNTFTNQRRGDNVGPTIQRITGAYNAEPASPQDVARLIWGSPSNPGAGNTVAIGRRLQRIFGDGSPQMQTYKQGLLNHILNTPEGMEALTPAKQADRLQTYLQTPHAHEFFTAADRTRLMQHAQELRAATPAAPLVQTEGQKIVQKLADGTLSEAGLIKRLVPPTGEVPVTTLSLLKELKGRVSQPTWNAIRATVWKGLNEKPDGLVEWGHQAMANRLSKFLDERAPGQFGEAARMLFDPRELAAIRKFADFHESLAYKPGNFNPSNSANVGAKLAQHGLKHLFTHIGTMLGGHTIVGRLTGMAAGEAVGRATARMTNAQQVERTRELFLGKKGMRELNPQYQRAAAILGHAARPLINGGP